MKRVIYILVMMLMVAILLMPVVHAEEIDWNALAATTAETAVVIDWNGVINDAFVWLIRAVAAIAGGVLVYLWRKYAIPIVIPWLQDKKLFELAKILVQAAEAEFGRRTGALKWDQVVTWFQERGYTIDERVRQAIEAAWQELDFKMREAGMKEAATDDAFSSTKSPVQLE